MAFSRKGKKPRFCPRYGSPSQEFFPAEAQAVVRNSSFWPQPDSMMIFSRAPHSSLPSARPPASPAFPGFPTFHPFEKRWPAAAMQRSDPSRTMTRRSPSRMHSERPRLIYMVKKDTSYNAASGPARPFSRFLLLSLRQDPPVCFPSKSPRRGRQSCSPSAYGGRRMPPYPKEWRISRLRGENIGESHAGHRFDTRHPALLLAPQWVCRIFVGFSPSLYHTSTSHSTSFSDKYSLYELADSFFPHFL